MKVKAIAIIMITLFMASMFTVALTDTPTADGGKIYFLMSPDPHAIFQPPVGKVADVMYVSVAVVKDSTFGSFKIACFGYDTRYEDYTLSEIYWYTDNLRACEVFAYLKTKIFPMDKWVYTVTLAKIDILQASEHHLRATVLVDNKILFKANFLADKDRPLESRLDPILVPEKQFRGVEAYRPLLEASVTGLKHGDLKGGRFDYIDTELYDSSLLRQWKGALTFST